MAKPMHPTPNLDQLETGPWPSFVTGLKRLAKDKDYVVDVLGHLEHSYQTRKGYWKGGTVGVIGYGGGVIPRFTEIKDEGGQPVFKDAAEFHTLRIMPPPGMHYDTDTLRKFCDIWEQYGSGLIALHGQSGDIMFQGCTTENVQKAWDEINEMGFDLGGAGPALRTSMSCVGHARCEMSNFDEARATLAMHLGTLALPEWLATETRSLAQWRGFGRLATLTHRWRERRFEGDAAAFGALEAWRAQDEHLWDWEANQRRKTLLYRRELYRIAAADLARRYETVVLEKFDLRAVATLPDATSASSDNDNARSVRFVAAPSELRLAVTQAFVARSGRVEHVDAAGTTYICAACGSAEEWDQARELRHTCSRCAREWDQDDNAARNILARAPAPNEEMAAAPARYEGRWQRVKARKKEAL